MNKRLLEVSKYIKGFNKLLDVGCDHGYLPIYCIENEYIEEAIASDINELPLNQAKINIYNKGLTDKIKLQLSDGIENLVHDVDIVSICGMGGSIISKMFDNIKELHVKRIIIQANVASDNVRKILNKLEYKITDEVIIRDKSIDYIIMVFDKGIEELSNLEIKFGPILLKNKSSLFIKKLEVELDKYKKIINNIPNGNKREVILNNINEIEGILNENN